MAERDAFGRFLPQNKPGTPPATQVRVVMTALDRFTESFIKKMALDVVANLSRAPSEGGTPVDTGWARANWLASVTQPITEPAGDPENVSAAESEKEAGLGKVLAYRLSAGSVFISNNVPYITRLNDGYSQQAPAGFVQRAIQEAVTNIRAV